MLIARALASRPKLLLLDEVANGLDARNHARFLRWLNGTARSSMPWVFATHRQDRRARLDDPSARAGAGQREAQRRACAPTRRARCCSRTRASSTVAPDAARGAGRASAACSWPCAMPMCTWTRRTSSRTSTWKCAPGTAGWCTGRMARASPRCCGLSTAITPWRRAAASCAPASCPACRSRNSSCAPPTWRRTCRPGMSRRCR